MTDLSELKHLIKFAGDKVLSLYKKSVQINYKADQTAVTEADFVSQKVLISGLKKFNYPIISEESADNKDRLSQEYVWIIDPIDGTKRFIDQTDDFCILLGLVYQGEPIIGLSYLPVKQNLYYAQKGKGAFLEDKKGTIKHLNVSNRNQIKDMVMTLSPNYFETVKKMLVSKILEDKYKITKFIQSGSAGIKSCLVAEGTADIYAMPFSFMNEWDTCATQIIVEEAGGIVTDIYGRKLTYNKLTPRMEQGFLISNGKQHKKLIELLKKLL